VTVADFPIIFLDVDGVLNSYDQLKESKRLRGMAPKHVAELARVLRETDAKVVVSSAWRFELNDDGSSRRGTRFRDELLEKGDDGRLVLKRIIGRTKDLWEKAPDKKSVRGFEIQTWREEHDHDGTFVIVDDDSDMGPLKPRLVKTDNALGLTRKEGDEMIRLLTEVERG
jgi:hypothetical protein